MEWMSGLRKTRPIYILSTRDLLQIYRHTQTDNESVEKDIYSIQMKTTTKAGVAILISGKIKRNPHHNETTKNQRKKKGAFNTIRGGKKDRLP